MKKGEIMDLINLDEAAIRYHCSKKKMYREVKAGEIKAFKPGNKILIDKKSGDDWFNSTQIRPRKRAGRPRKKGAKIQY